MGRIFAICYGISAYILFLLTFLYSIGFVGNLLVPKSVDSGVEGPFAISLVINAALLLVFALQHTIMARPQFKKIWTTIIPKPVERSTYVWFSSFALILLFSLWQPMLGVVWDVSGTPLGMVLQAFFWMGWCIVLMSTFMIDHFELVGLRQVYLNFKQKEISHTGFQKRIFYKLVRHPIMSGFIIAFWSAPVMTVGHLVFAVATTTYTYIAVKYFEEKDLVAAIGSDYVDYQKEVGMLVPGIGKK